MPQLSRLLFGHEEKNVGYGEQRWSLCRSPPPPWLPSGQQQRACASCPVCARRTVVWQLTYVPLSIVQRTLTIVASVATPIPAPTSRTGAAHTLADGTHAPSAALAPPSGSMQSSHLPRPRSPRPSTCSLALPAPPSPRA